ncbi:hypothetical protein ACA758_00895 [Mycoplasmopsis agassizii]|uniref:hypothetical protein n=1 Tax=Mycoplasmopsis agassizii TaxID=33922 RepID=UPI0035273075
MVVNVVSGSNSRTLALIGVLLSSKADSPANLSAAVIAATLVFKSARSVTVVAAV